MEKWSLYNTIETLLRENPALRENDCLLEAAVCRAWNPRFDDDDFKASEFIVLRDTLGYPSRENITRTKRRVQADHKELQKSGDIL